MDDLVIFTDPAMERHATGDGHPERPERLGAALARLDSLAPRRAASPAPHAAMAAVHDEDYLARLEETAGRDVRLDADTVASPASWEAARLAAGCLLAATDAVLDGESRVAASIVRPPGHHAERDRAMGFCLVNNVAVAARHALARGDARRVLIVDWDVHHGNGTQHVFDERDDVLVFDVHQHPLYPGTGLASERGVGRGEGYTINVPLPAGRRDADYAAVFDELLLPVAELYEPELVFVSAGFDAHHLDPLAGQELTDEGFAFLASRIRSIADHFAEGRIVVTLEGGYDLRALEGSTRRTLEALVSGDADEPDDPVGRDTHVAIEACRTVHRDRWNL